MTLAQEAIGSDSHSRPSNRRAQGPATATKPTSTSGPRFCATNWTPTHAAPRYNSPA